jgi:hypothetical protein
VLDRCRYHWPENIRELQNVIERAVILSCDTAFVVCSRRYKLARHRYQPVRTRAPHPPGVGRSAASSQKWIASKSSKLSKKRMAVWEGQMALLLASVSNGPPSLPGGRSWVSIRTECRNATERAPTLPTPPKRRLCCHHPASQAPQNKHFAEKRCPLSVWHRPCLLQRVKQTHDA